MGAVEGRLDAPSDRSAVRSSTHVGAGNLVPDGRHSATAPSLPKQCREQPTQPLVCTIVVVSLVPGHLDVEPRNLDNRWHELQAQRAGLKLFMVRLDSAGKYSRIGDAERIRKWLAYSPLAPQAMAPQQAVTGPLVQPIDLVKLR